MNAMSQFHAPLCSKCHAKGKPLLPACRQAVADVLHLVGASACGCAPRCIEEAAMVLCGALSSRSGALHGTNFAVLVHVQKTIE
jgi:hypothetical protein